MNILIVNHSTINCGVYQYGKRVASILKKSTKHNFIYLEAEDERTFLKSVEEHAPEIIIYNYLPGTMPWMSEEVHLIMKTIKGIKQMLIVHNVGYATFFDYFLHQDPYFSSDGAKNFNLLRPLFNYTPPPKIDSDVIKISSFGFGFSVKHFDQLCQLVNSQFMNETVEIRLHTTYAHFGREANQLAQIKRACEEQITRKDITLKITTDFISDEELLNFLSESDLNIFLYQKYGSYNGISSCIDYALSVERPIAICESNMFSHIWGVEPSILIEKQPLQNIILNGFGPLAEKKDAWSNENFIKHVESILENV